jgi:hypothetical protein
MRRLCTESSCPYSGRSARQAAGVDYGSRTEARGESRGTATGPYRSPAAARVAATQGVTGQKSAEAVVANRGRSLRR